MSNMQLHSLWELWIEILGERISNWKSANFAIIDWMIRIHNAYKQIAVCDYLLWSTQGREKKKRNGYVLSLAKDHAQKTNSPPRSIYKHWSWNRETVTTEKHPAYHTLEHDGA